MCSTYGYRSASSGDSGSIKVETYDKRGTSFHSTFRHVMYCSPYSRLNTNNYNLIIDANSKTFQLYVEDKAFTTHETQVFGYRRIGSNT